MVTQANFQCRGAPYWGAVAPTGPQTNGAEVNCRDARARKRIQEQSGAGLPATPGALSGADYWVVLLEDHVTRHGLERVFKSRPGSLESKTTLSCCRRGNAAHQALAESGRRRIARSATTAFSACPEPAPRRLTRGSLRPLRYALLECRRRSILCASRKQGSCQAAHTL